jgi:hypothetical protein
MRPTAGLPVLPAGWLAALLDAPIPEETEATCDRCVMVSTLPGIGFHPESKCCTYTPELHNFLVGAMLDEPGEGATTVRARLERKIAVSPLGLHRPRTHLVLYDDGGPAMFGRTRAMRCPHHLDDGRCGVWRHREATCTTWFCKFSRGQTGQRFWHALHRLLATVERNLAWWCLQELGFPAQSLEVLLRDREASQLKAQRLQASELDGLPPGGYRAIWGDWVGREEALFRECARLVAALSWAEVLGHCGATARTAAAIVRLRHAELLSEALPERLVAGAFRVLGFSTDTCRIVAYSEHDPVDIPSALLEVLPCFDGRPIDEVITDLASRGIEIEPEYLARLVDVGVLVARAD